MEEFVGMRWHNLINRLARTSYPEAQVRLEDEGPRLAMVFRALGGDPGLVIKAATERALKPPRHWLEKIAGTGRQYALAWRDEDSVRLPPVIQAYPERELNRDLYLWLIALASQASTPEPDQWLQWNQQQVLLTLQRFPGLGPLYQRLAWGLVAVRPSLDSLNAAQQRRERCLRTAILEPGSQQALPVADGDSLPVPLWLYPSLHPAKAAVSRQDGGSDVSNGGLKPKQGKGRKRAEFIDDIDGKDGLIVFRLESLFSWSEFVPVDRTLDDSEDDEADRVAEDLDHLSLSRHGDAGASRLKLDLDLPSAAEDDIPLGAGMLLPEWDWRKQLMVPRYCRVIPMLPKDATPCALPDRLQAMGQQLRRRFEVLRPQQAWNKRQPSGPTLDLEACIDFASARQRGLASAQPALWRQQAAQHRDLACLVLADLSLSTEAYADNEHQVIDVVRDSMHLLGEALDAGNDAFAMYGFSSKRRDHVRFSVIKNFAEPWGEPVHGRIQALRPGYYTRMGAAIRQATEILKEQPAEQRLLLLLTDGKPNDLDLYEGRYGMEDTRHALLEARKAGLEPFCVTIDQQAADYLPYLFGPQRFHLLHNAAELPTLLPRLYLLLTGRTP
ncbi:nitric oxide reductase activation protein NorD [Halopseudomonas pelagia]|uniref:nitric oxide reductase activation protein NorD n=1 Tax=Halopseudomonas pelagia TaxID=553151 RepID=UPI0003A7F797|nr:VWA domain-containing protein [Halopseudomonas pelagia]